MDAPVKVTSGAEKWTCGEWTDAAWAEASRGLRRVRAGVGTEVGADVGTVGADVGAG